MASYRQGGDFRNIMVTASVHCPYCNATISLNPDAAAGPRIQCPHCHDSFPNRAVTNGQASSALAELAGSNLRLSNATLARLIVGGMALLAVVGLIYALATVNYRRSKDFKSVTAATPPPVKPTSPANLPALGYLPEDCCVVAGIHLGQVLDDPKGKKLLEQAQFRNANLGLAQLESWTGLKPEQIDNIALGLQPDALVRGATVVVRMRGSYSQNDLAKALQPIKATEVDGKHVYRVQSGSPQRMIWRFDDQTLVMQVSITGVNLDDVKKFPTKPNTGAAGLPKPIQNLMEQHLDKQSILWAVGELGQVKLLASAIQLLQIPPAVKPLIAQLDAFTAGVILDKDVTLMAALRGKDSDSANALYQLFNRPTGLQPKLTKPDLTEPLWVLLQWRTDLEHTAEIIADPLSLLTGK
jgi:hypothetical protein